VRINGMAQRALARAMNELRGIMITKGFECRMPSGCRILP